MAVSRWFVFGTSTRWGCAWVEDSSWRMNGYGRQFMSRTVRPAWVPHFDFGEEGL